MKLALLQRVLPAYREPVFEALRAQAKAAGHEFTLLASPATHSFGRRGTEGTLPWMRTVPVLTLPQVLGAFEWQRLPWREMLAADVLVVPDSARCLSNLAVLLLRRLWGKPVLTWGHGANFQPNRLSRVLATLRYRLLRLATGHLVYTDDCVAPLVAAGFDRTRIATTENAIDATAAQRLHPLHPEVLAFRAQHGLGNAPCVVFLGSWYARKRPERVVQIGTALREWLPDAHVLVIGGGDGLGLLRAQCPPWLTLLGPLHGREKLVALSAASCLAVTGVAGLNLLDAMSVGLPVVLPRRDDHSPEVAYVRHEENGLVVPDDVPQMAEACSSLLLDAVLQARLASGARRTAATLTVQGMAANILAAMVVAGGAGQGQSRRQANPDGSGSPRRLASGDDGIGRYFLGAGVGQAETVVLVYQRMLPYHQARFAALAECLRQLGKRCIALEVASFDRGYGAIQIADAGPGKEDMEVVKPEVICLFPGKDYLDLWPGQVARAVFRALGSLAPTVVFTPAPAFAEGAGALHYKVRRGGKLVLMDDAWARTDRRGGLVRWVKRQLYGFVDGGFFPSVLHGAYFEQLNIPRERQRYGVDAVGAVDGGVRVDPKITPLQQPYLLFVGRLIARKGLQVVLRALAESSTNLTLVVIGDGPEGHSLREFVQALGLSERVRWLGRQGNDVARGWMTKAQAVVVPSEFEQWGLVVNEAWMAPTLVLGSDTVGALRATYPPDMRWMMPPVGDVQAWRAALERLASMHSDTRADLLRACRELAEQYSLAAHVRSALALMELPPRPRPSAPVAWLARAWQGRVAVW